MNGTYDPDVRLEMGAGRRSWLTPMVVIGATTAANALILGLAWEMHGSFPVAKVNGDEQAIRFGLAILVTLLAGLTAWGLLVLLARTTCRAVTIWTMIAGVVLALSLIGRLTNGIDDYSKATLACLHLSAAAILMPWLPRSRR